MLSKTLVPKKRYFVGYMLPGILLYTVMTFVPVVMAGYYSLFNWSGGKKMTFIGLGNFVEMLHDQVFWQAFRNNIYLTVVCAIGQIGLAFFFAMLLNSKCVKIKGVHRALAYFPVTLSAVVVGFVWTMIYDYNYGLLNEFVKHFLGPDKIKPWLSDPEHAMFFVSIPIIWQYIGYYLVIILSGLTSLDTSVFEAATIDGCNAFQRTVHVTLPLMKNNLIVCMMLCISGNMKSFDHIFVMTGGGPGTSTNLMALHAYKMSFLNYRMGYGTALSIGILVLSLAIILGFKGIVRIFNKEDD